MPDADLRQVSISAIAPEVGLARRLRDRYPPGATPNGVAYLFAVGGLFLPPLGLVAIALAARELLHGRRALVALVVSVLATAIGVAAWTFVLFSDAPAYAPTRM